jgi:hypothetical protein
VIAPGGNTDIWDGQGDTSSQTVNGHLPGQPCATTCQNLRNPANIHPWNQVTYNGGDGISQQSFMYQVYNPSTPLVGTDVVIFDGAMGQQTLDHWDPTSIGYFAQSGNYCNFGHQGSVNPECNYDRVFDDLYRNGLSEAQVQAIFLKTSDEYPRCDLKHSYCDPSFSTPDAYQSEIYLGDILRYLRCCKFGIQGSPGNVPRYPNLQQVFLTSRIYGGYANGIQHGCLMPEPYAYEEGFAIQRMIVAQINSTADTYSGDVHYNPNPTPGGAPWFDWGPYIWASGPNQSPGNSLYWCDTTTDPQLHPICTGDTGNVGDFRWGDLTPGYSEYWGDHTHPSYKAVGKIATQLVKFIQGTLPYPQGGSTNPNNISNWILPWITT